MTYLAACAIFRNEGVHLAEWLRFHLGVGTEHFFLYDNESDDDSVAVLRDTLPANRFTLMNIRGRRPQLPAYRHCVDLVRGRVRWLALFDLDEFLFRPDGVDLRPLLAGFEGVACLTVQRLEFGHNGHRTPPPGPTTRHYTRRARDRWIIPHPAVAYRPELPEDDMRRYMPVNSQVKSIVDPQKVVDCTNPHVFVPVEGGTVVNENGDRSGSAFFPPVYQRIRINHYWSRSEAELAAKLARPRADTGAPYTPDFREYMHQKLHVCMAQEDTSILPICQRIGLPGHDQVTTGMHKP